MCTKKRLSALTAGLLIGAMSLSIGFPANAADFAASGEEISCATALQEQIVAKNINTDVQSYSDCLKVVEAYSDFGVSTNDLQQLIEIDPSMAVNILEEQETYQFSDKEVQQYVQGLLETPTTRVYSNDPEYAITETESGDIQTTDGNIYPKPNAEQPSWEIASNSLVNNAVIAPAAVYSYSTTYNSSDATGAYWVVKAATGFDTATQRVELPNLVNYNSMDTPYVMYGVYTSGTSGDYGIYYAGDKNAWYGFFGKSCINTPSVGEWTGAEPDGVPIPVGTAVYMYCYLESPEWVRIRVVDNANFSKVYYDVSVYQEGYAIPSSSSIYKEITLAQHKSENGGIVNTSTGTQMRNANVVDSYLYNDYTTTKWNPSNVRSAARSCQTLAKAQTVHVNSYTAWSDENISILFTQ